TGDYFRTGSVCSGPMSAGGRGLFPSARQWHSQPKLCRRELARTSVEAFWFSGLDEDLDLTLALDLPDELLELLLALPLHQVIPDLPADLGKRRRARRAPFVNLDDVVAERRFDDSADRTGLERKRGILELRVHLTLREEPQ